MKMNKKGFTLIELLAVIVILAIIALIATPIILGVIDNARRNAARDAAYGVIDKLRLDYVETLYEGNAVVAYSGTVDSTLGVSGTKPSEGSWSIDDNGDVHIFNVVFGEYTCSGMGEGVSCSRAAH